MDKNNSNSSTQQRVIILGTSNHVNDIDKQFRRGGRFEIELEVTGNEYTDRIKYYI